MEAVEAALTEVSANRMSLLQLQNVRKPPPSPRPALSLARACVCPLSSCICMTSLKLGPP